MQKTEFTCPTCGKKMKLDTNENVLYCTNWFVRHTYSLAEFLLAPDLSINVGKTKSNGQITFLFNSKTNKFAIEVEKSANLNSDICNFGPFEIGDLLEIQVIQDNNVVYENKSSVVPMIAGGMLFGPMGAVAGSIISNKKENIKKLTTLILKINEILLPSLYIETYDKDVVFKFINTIEFLKSKAKKLKNNF